MIKVCFVSHHFKNPDVFLKTLLKMTPKQSGTWKTMTAITDPMKADFCIVFDGANVPIPNERAIYFGEHPTGCTTFTKWENKPALLKFPLDKYLNPGEWWITTDYDTLMKLEPPQKKKQLICVTTAHRRNQPHLQTYRDRISFLHALCPKLTFDLYGRPASNFTEDAIFKNHYKGILGVPNPRGVLGEHMMGKEMLIDYKYSLEFDVGPTKNYLSERFYDALLLWTMPFYYGSVNAEQFIPKNAFHYIEIPDVNKTVQNVIDLLQEDVYEARLSAIKEARELLLNKYQIWPYVYDIITNIEKYK